MPQTRRLPGSLFILKREEVVRMRCGGEKPLMEVVLKNELQS